MLPKVVASECCAGLHPQNTLKGFNYCLDSGVDGIEFDVHLSLDGHVVVQHDYLLNRRITRNASGSWLARSGPAIRDMTLAEIKSFDVGRYLADSVEEKTYPNYEAADGEEIPTLEEFLRRYQSAQSEAELWIELKTTPFERSISANPDALLAEVLRLLKQYDLVSKTILLAFEWQVLLNAKTVCPDIGLDFLTINPDLVRRLHRGDDTINPEDMYLPVNPGEGVDGLPAAINEVGGGWWGPYIGDVTANNISVAQKTGLLVNVWGVESTDEAIEAALRLNADAITISDTSMLQRKLANAVQLT